jgi:hypothetical protein
VVAVVLQHVAVFALGRRCDRGDECIRHLEAVQRGAQVVDITGDELPTGVGDIAGDAKHLRLAAHLDHLVHGHSRQHPHEAIEAVMLFVELAKRSPLQLMANLVQRIPFASLERAGLDATQALVDVRGKAAPRKFTVVWNVDADFDLLADHLADAIADGEVQRIGVVGFVERARFHALDDRARPDQATDVGSQDTIDAAIHRRPEIVGARPLIVKQSCNAIDFNGSESARSEHRQQHI